MAEPYRLPQLNAVKVPSGVDEADVRRRLLNEYNLEIGAGLGDLAGKVWRIGLMGYASREQNVKLCVQALGEILGVQRPTSRSGCQAGNASLTTSISAAPVRKATKWTALALRSACSLISGIRSAAPI